MLASNKEDGRVLVVSNIDAGYGQLRVLRDIEMELFRGESVLLIGPNGCGKSTILKAIVGMADLFTGEILLNGERIDEMETDRRVRKGISYLAQTHNIFPSLTVRENLEICRSAREHSLETEQAALQGFPFLQSKLDQRAGSLSGGERQALAICMTLSARSSVYLFDEPSAGLAPRAASELLGRIQEMQRELQLSCLIVEHKLKEICPWVDRALVLRAGRLAADVRDPEALLAQGALDAFYFRDR